MHSRASSSLTLAYHCELLPVTGTQKNPVLVEGFQAGLKIVERDFFTGENGMRRRLWDMVIPTEPVILTVPSLQAS